MVCRSSFLPHSIREHGMYVGSSYLYLVFWKIDLEEKCCGSWDLLASIDRALRKESMPSPFIFAPTKNEMMWIDFQVDLSISTDSAWRGTISWQPRASFSVLYFSLTSLMIFVRGAKGRIDALATRSSASLWRLLSRPPRTSVLMWAVPWTQDFQPQPSEHMLLLSSSFASLSDFPHQKSLVHAAVWWQYVSYVII